MQNFLFLLLFFIELAISPCPSSWLSPYEHASVPPPGCLHPDEDDHVAQEGEEGARDDAREASKLQAGHSY